MSASKRQTKKAAQRIFYECFDPADYDYDRLVRPGRGRSRLVGVAVGSVIYFTAYAAAYTGYSKGLVSETTLGKLAWLFIVPAAVVGAIVWMVTDSRAEYAIRQRIAGLIARQEEGDGTLWRFGPLLAEAKFKGVNVEEVLAVSQAGQGARIDPQDYSRLVVYLRDLLDGGDSVMNGSQAEQLAKNLALE